MNEPRPNPQWFTYRPVDPDQRAAPYEVSQTRLIGPPLAGDLVLTETADELIDKLAADLVVHAENCVREFGDFHLALSGGQTPQPLYERLMYDPNYRRLPWRRTHLWLVDERCVGFDDPRSNFRLIDETIVDHADIPREQVHPMFALSPGGDIEYQEQIREALAWREKGQDRLDYVLLGLGADGHTASLFPGSAALREDERLVCFTRSEQADPPERMTMTFPLINSARFIAVLAVGRTKASAIRTLAVGGARLDILPIAGVCPIHGELKWYLDAAACGINLAPSRRT